MSDQVMLDLAGGVDMPQFLQPDQAVTRSTTINLPRVGATEGDPTLVIKVSSTMEPWSGNTHTDVTVGGFDVMSDEELSRISTIIAGLFSA